MIAAAIAKTKASSRRGRPREPRAMTAPTASNSPSRRQPSAMSSSAARKPTVGARARSASPASENPTAPTATRITAPAIAATASDRYGGRVTATASVPAKSTSANVSARPSDTSLGHGLSDGHAVHATAGPLARGTPPGSRSALARVGGGLPMGLPPLTWLVRTEQHRCRGGDPGFRESETVRCGRLVLHSECTVTKLSSSRWLGTRTVRPSSASSTVVAPSIACTVPVMSPTVMVCPGA